MPFTVLYKFQPLVSQRSSRLIGVRVLGVLNKYRHLIYRDYVEFTQFWNHAVPIRVLERFARGDVFVSVGTDDKIFMWVDEGTNVRYANMTPGFVRKTNPGSLHTNPGQGGLWFVSKKTPHPGIEPRHFEQMMLEEYEEEFFNDLRRAILSAWMVSDKGFPLSRLK